MSSPVHRSDESAFLSEIKIKLSCFIQNEYRSEKDGANSFFPAENNFFNIFDSIFWFFRFLEKSGTSFLLMQGLLNCLNFQL